MKSKNTWIIAATLLATGGMTQMVAADERTAGEILKDMDAVAFPDYDKARAEEEGYHASYFKKRADAQVSISNYILELYETHPDHEQILELMPTRWGYLLGIDEHWDGTVREIRALVARDSESALAVEARFSFANGAVGRFIWGPEENRNVEEAQKAVEEFVAAIPADERGASLLGHIATAYEFGSDDQVAMYERITTGYPEARGTKFITGKIRQIKGLGKPFELAFTDAITGTEISMADFKGRVVVVDFWATWCGPCVAEMPHMQDLYAKFHDEGVEFIAVSLDFPEEKHDGLTALKDYVAENELPFLQYYQGNGWDGEFSTSWGVNSIPALFVVDKQGNLHSTQARGELEEMIPALLAK